MPPTKTTKTRLIILSGDKDQRLANFEAKNVAAKNPSAIITPYQRIVMGPSWKRIDPGDWNITGCALSTNIGYNRSIGKLKVTI